MDAHISIHGEGELGISAGLFAALLIVLIAAPGSLLPVGGRETVIDENVWANRLADWLQGVFLESRVSEDDVAYEASGGGMQARLSSEGIQLLIEADEAPIRISLVGANAVEPRGSVVTDARLYSFRGSPAGLGFRAYESVVYPAIYPGIDLVFETTREGLKYEFRLAPGANPGRIALAYDTGTTLRLREDGALAIRRGNTVLLDAPPSAFQPSGPVPCQYDLITTYSHGFRCWNWNPSEPLVIDPFLYATLIGGQTGDLSPGETATAVALDGSGNVYVTGYAGTTDFPATPGAFDTTFNGGIHDIFVAKFDASGRLVYATYVGGNHYDEPSAIAADAAGNVFVVGSTGSDNFPTSVGALAATYQGGFRDAFVIKLNAAGSGLLYSTYLGGSGDDFGGGIALDAMGNAFVSGSTTSMNLPTTLGAYDTSYNGGSVWGGDAFLVKLNAQGGALVYGTYLGGSRADNAFLGLGAGMFVDGSGTAYVAGSTESSDFPTTGGAYDRSHNGGVFDAFVLRISAAGTDLLFSTLFGGGNREDTTGLAVDGMGNVYLSGLTQSSNLPSTTNAMDRTLDGFFDGFVAKLTSDGGSLNYATYVGGGNSDEVWGLALDPGGNAVVVGYSASTDFVTIPGAPDRSMESTEGFVLVLNATGAGPVYSTFLGGAAAEIARALVIDSAGVAHVVGWTNSADFPTTPGAFDTSLGGIGDGFYAKVDMTSTPITLRSVPPARTLEIEGRSVTAPVVVWCALGSTPGINAPSPQFAVNTRYRFVAWADGGAQAHAVPCTGPATYVAAFAAEYETTVESIPFRRLVEVDGSVVTTPQTYWWEGGSTHTLDVPSPQDAGTARYTFESWSDGGSKNHAVLASGPSSYVVFFSREYELRVDTSPEGLSLEIDGVPTVAPFARWCPDGASANVSVPSPQAGGRARFHFAFWSDGGARMHEVFCDTPKIVTAHFDPEYEIRITTAPPGMTIAVDGTPALSPYAFWCPGGATRTLDVPSPQTMGTTQYAFSSWSDGGAQSHGIVCADVKDLVVSFLATAHEVTVRTNPDNLRVLIGGEAREVPYAFWCQVGARIALDIPTPQGGPRTRLAFASWSDGGGRMHDLLCDGPKHVTASFAFEHEVTISTVPPGMAIEVDGAAAVSPYAFWCRAGESVAVDVPTPQGGSGTRLAFASWSDSGAKIHDVPCEGPNHLTASFVPEYEIRITTDPPGNAIEVEGAPATSPIAFWCQAGESVALDVPTPEGGPGTRHEFASWSDGEPRARTVSCTEPRSLIAEFSAEHRIELETIPGRFAIRVNGETLGSPASVWCDENGAVEVEVAEVERLEGREYRFRGWSDMGGRAHSVPCAGPTKLTATFEEEPLGAAPLPTWAWAAVAAFVGLAVGVALWRRRSKERKGEGSS